MLAQQRYEERVHVKLSDIARDYANAKAQTSDAKRLEALKKLRHTDATYRRGSKRDKQILFAYRTDIAKERRYFTKKNKAALASATLNAKKLKAADEQTVQTADQALAKLLKTIRSEKTVVYTAEQSQRLETKITALRKSYATRLKSAAEPAAEASTETTTPAGTDTSDQSASSQPAATGTEDDSATDGTTTDTADTTDTTSGTAGTATGSNAGTTTASTSDDTSSRSQSWTPAQSQGTATGTATTGTDQGTDSTAGGANAATASGTSSSQTGAGSASETSADTSTAQGGNAYNGG